MPLIASAPRDRIILGLMTFGPDASAGARITDVSEFNRCLDTFQARGYNEVDTARVYIDGQQEAFTRETKWKERGLTLATKFKYPAEAGTYQAAKVVESLETSLKELGTESVDIIYLHAADRATPFAETLEAVDKLHKAGKFVQFGISNFTAAEVAEVVLTCKYNGWVRPTVYQGMYNAITRGIEAELIPTCRRYGLDIVVYNPIAGGLFSGKIKSVDIDPAEGRFSTKSSTGANYRRRYFKESTFKALQTAERAVEKHPELSLVEVALRWVVHHSKLKIKGGTDGILIGVSSHDQLVSNLDNLEKGPLPEDVLQALDEAWKIAQPDAPNYWHKDLVYTYDTRAALFGPGANIPARLQPTYQYSKAEPSPLSASSYGSSIEDYIGSGTDTVGGRTPVFDRRLRAAEFRASESDSDDDETAMSGNKRPAFLRPADGRAVTPLLKKIADEDRGRSRYSGSLPATPMSLPISSPATIQSPYTPRSTVRSLSPDTQARMAVRKKYTYAAVFLVVSLVSFCIQTELGRYVQHELGWDKAYCMLYLTHGSWALLWPVQLVILRIQKRDVPWPTFWRRHLYLLRSTAHMVAQQETDIPRHVIQRSPLPYMIRTTAFITTSLTVAGLSWYVAVSMTTPSDLTAIYNCSAFFAYAFSVPLLKEKLRLDKSISVLIAIAGVLVVAYGDPSGPAAAGGDGSSDNAASTRFLGNMIIGAGSVLYGLYEVMYKRWACPPEGTSATRGMIFANAFGTCIGLFTLLVLWVPLPVLHVLGWETFEIPTGAAAFYLIISIVMNATFAGSFLVMISLTSPVLSSVAALLTIFIVAVVDWLLTGQSMGSATVTGGCMIVVAFLMLSWSTWREMAEDAERKTVIADGPVGAADWSSDDDDKDDDRLD
ncbi:NADP-dependent oxidoreductase domain-containing protein [Durotheca rogersii]|uniref:NADP-dependent oxidoreductase domain-containing protein n=1 Tax=Durotheca rogersii TaxID=419775 RepID=UPI00221F1B0F|nr:NADP-dependent oxidoreductase domain-containing protein [Durotheca rogersii]KAI5856204.1 NADP-dependent oxidoreductase domain-containing protein [Durotheca rogersii]